jgi:hypothetical protein
MDFTTPAPKPQAKIIALHPSGPSPHGLRGASETPPGPDDGALQIQRFDDLYTSTPSAQLLLADALQAIASGTYAPAILEARAIYRDQGEDAYRTAKNRLPQYTFAGTFHPTRAKDNLVQHSEVCHADIDHLTDLGATRQRLMADPAVLYCFTSPRGDGLKYGVRIPRVDSDETYKHAWGVLAAAHLDAYGVTWDPTGKDICRLCFASWDPACYVNPAAQVYTVPLMIIPEPLPRPVAPARIPGDRQHWYAQRGIERAVQLIAESREGGAAPCPVQSGVSPGGLCGRGAPLLCRGLRRACDSG